MNNTSTNDLPKRTRGKPKQLPLNARRVTIGQLSEEDIALLSLLGKGNITQGIRELCKLTGQVKELINLIEFQSDWSDLMETVKPIALSINGQNLSHSL